MDDARKCYIHLGPPKTGSTALQVMLGNAAAALRERGLLYPGTGRPSPRGGHVEIPWQMAAHKDAIHDAPAVKQLMDEIEPFEGSVLLSAEVFSFAIFHEDIFAKFVKLLQSHGFEVAVIAYLRNQVDSLEASYLQYVIGGYADSFDEFLAKALKNDLCRIRGYTFTFDHLVMLRHLQGFDRLEVIARSYDSADGAICSDFLSLFGLRLSDLGLAGEPRQNARQPIRTYLLKFLENRLSRTLQATEIATIDALLAASADVEATISEHARQRIAECFRHSNARVAAEFAIADPGLAQARRPAAAASKSMTIDWLFSAQFQNMVVARSRADQVQNPARPA